MRATYVLPGLAISLGLLTTAGCGSGAALSADQVARLRGMGVAPDLVYLVDVKGFEMAEQSMSGVGDEGFGVSYVSPEGHLVQLRVVRGSFDHAACIGTPIDLAEPPTAVDVCERDDVGWYREGGGRREYVHVDGDHFLRLTGSTGEIDRPTLKAAMSSAHHAAGDWTEPPAERPGPVERGDLPEHGDGAPINTVGPGG